MNRFLVSYNKEPVHTRLFLVARKMYSIQFTKFFTHLT